MSELRYQPQLQQQQQEGPPAAPAADQGAPEPNGAGDDALILDILGSGEPEPETPEREVQEEDEPEPETPPDDAADPEPDEEEDEEDEPLAAEADDGDLAAARKAREEGNLEQAIMLAFGCKPEDLLPNPKAWTAWRKANEREDHRRRGEAQAFERDKQTAIGEIRNERIQIHNTIEQLKPYEKLYHAQQAWQREGDPAHLVALIEGITQMPYSEAQKIILTKTKRSPQERQMAERLQALERTLAEKETATQRQQEQQTTAQIYQQDLGHIRGAVSGEVTKVPKFAERIYNILVKTKGPLGITKTVEQAAAMVVRAERKRIAEHPFVKKPGAKAPLRDKNGKRVPPSVSDAARRLAARSGAPLRRNSQNNGAANAKDESTDDIVNDILRNKPKRLTA